MKIFFATLLWIAVFDIYTVLAIYSFLFKEAEGVKSWGDAIEFFDPLIRSITIYLHMIIFFLWKFWLLVWGHYYLMIKKIKNNPGLLFNKFALYPIGGGFVDDKHTAHFR